MNHGYATIVGLLIGLTLGLMATPGVGVEPQQLTPFESAERAATGSKIDRLAQTVWQKHDIKPAMACSDEVFVRRVYLDCIGTLPTIEEASSFLQDRRPRKRALLIDALLERDEFADYWSLKWCDLLRVKSEFPINLWPNAVQAYHRWVHDANRDNMPADQFARELLTASGSNFRNPPVNFYRAMEENDPATIARVVALTWMGSRIDTWPEERRHEMEAFFSRIAFKPTAEWKEEIVQLAPEPSGPMQVVFPDGTQAVVPEGQDPRVVFADWLITGKNPWFARNIVNRIWFWLLGRGLIHEPDDIRPGNECVHPRLLLALERELVSHRYDMKTIYRLILNSHLYQQSSIAQCDQAKAEKYFACYPVRRLDAEVLIDAINGIYGGKETYSSQIPEPYTFIPEEQRTIILADGSITSPFLELFGRPSRDTGMLSERDNETTRNQRLYMINSTHIQRKIERSDPLRQLIRGARGKPNVVVNMLYSRLLSRPPTEHELAVANEYFKNGGVKFHEAAIDLAWALTNSKEFLYRH